MPEQYHGLGLSILYPDNWTVDEDEVSSVVTIESPGGAAMTVTRLDDSEDLQSPMDQAKIAMEAEYDLVEQESIERDIEGVQLVGITQRFVYLDLIVASHLLSFKRDGIAYLVQIQAEDRDMERLEQVFEAILVSLCRPTPTDAQGEP